MGPEIKAEIGHSRPKKFIKLRSGPKHVSQIPKKKTYSPPKQLPNSAQEKSQNEGDPDKVAEI